MTKGDIIPAWLAMWLPNIVLGIAGVALLMSRARSADQPIRISLPRVDAVPLARRSRVLRPAGPQRRGRRRGNAQLPPRDRVVVVVRIPQFELPRPNLLDIYVARQYLRILGMTMVAMLGLFYISTFLDLSDKWFKGQTTFGQILAFLWWSTPQFMSYIIALAVLLAALVTIGVLTKNSELIVMRACGVSLYRTAAPMLVFALVASAVPLRHGGTGAGAREPPRRSAEAPDSRRVGPDLRRPQPQVDRGPQRRGLPLPVLQSRARRELNGLSVFEFDPKTARADPSRVCRSGPSTSPGRPKVPEWQLSRGLERGSSAARHPRRPSSRSQTGRWPAGDRRLFRHGGARAPAHDLSAARIATSTSCGRAAMTCSSTRSSCTGRSRFPFVTLVMTFIAVPFAVTTGRRGAMYGIGVGIVLALVYWTMISVFAAFGAGGIDQPAAGGVGAEPAVRRRGGVSAAHGPDLT